MADQADVAKMPLRFQSLNHLMNGVRIAGERDLQS